MSSLLRAEIVLSATIRLLSQSPRITLDEISENTGVNRIFIEELFKNIGVEVKEGLVNTRLNVFLLRAWLAGYDVITLSLNSGWSTLEELVAEALSEAGFTSYRTIRFKLLGRRYEVDVLALKRGVALCIDCKRWQRLRESLLHRAAVAQADRCASLARAFEQTVLPIPVEPGVYRMLPTIVSLYKPRVSVYANTIVIDLKTVLQLSSDDALTVILSEIEPIVFQVPRQPRLF
ncbi:MAG: hypothetical protein ABWK01_00530 [Infirmifilum sp.]